jgi:GDSL-like Lipase/Acylhydrolase family
MTETKIHPLKPEALEQAVAATTLAAAEARAAVNFRSYGSAAEREADAAPNGTGARTLTSLGLVHHIRFNGKWRRVLGSDLGAVDALAPRNTDIHLFSGASLSDEWTTTGPWTVSGGAASSGGSIATLSGQTLADMDAVAMDSMHGVGITLSAPAGPWYNVARLGEGTLAVYRFPGPLGDYANGAPVNGLQSLNSTARGVLSVVRDGTNLRVTFGNTLIGSVALEPGVRQIGMRSEGAANTVYEFGVRRANPKGYALRNIHPARRIQSGQTIEFVGHSIMYGADGTATGTGPQLTPEGRVGGGPRSSTPIPESVRDRLAERGYTTTIKLHSYPGDRTREALKFWAGPGPGVSISVLGSLAINDVSNQGGYDGGGSAGFVPLDEYERNFRTLIVSRLEAGISVIIVGDPLPSIASVDITRMGRRYNACARDLAAEYGIPYVDANAALTSTAAGSWPASTGGGGQPGSANWCDGIHLSPMGCAAVGRLIADVIAGFGTLPPAYAIAV